MKIGKKDWIFLGVVGVVLAIFLAISGKETTTKVPYDEQHKASYEAFARAGKMEADKGCPACHYDNGGIAFPPKHPLKPKEGPMRCLFCHKLKKGGER